MSFTHAESMFVALDIQHAVRMRRIILSLWPVRLYSISALYLTNDTIITKALLNKKKMCALIFTPTFVWNSSRSVYPYPANVDNMASSTNTSKWRMGFNSAFKGLRYQRDMIINVHWSSS